MNDFVQHQLILIFAISFLFYFTVSAFAQTEELVSVETTELAYEEGDTIVIAGNVKSIILDTPVTIQIFYQSNLIEIAQLTVAQDGKYTHTSLSSLFFASIEFLGKSKVIDPSVLESTITINAKISGSTIISVTVPPLIV